MIGVGKTNRIIIFFSLIQILKYTNSSLMVSYSFKKKKKKKKKPNKQKQKQTKKKKKQSSRANGFQASFKIVIDNNLSAANGSSSTLMKFGNERRTASAATENFKPSPCC